MIIDFSNKTKSQKDALISQGYFFIVESSEAGKNLEIKESKRSKSSDQLRALYKLFQLCKPHFQKWKPAMNWDLESIKEFIKAELGYTRSPTPFEISMMIKQSGFTPKDAEEKKRMVNFCKKIKQNISFADFTKEQAFSFVKELEVWAHEKGWSDVYLTNEEEEAYLASLEKLYKKEE